MRDQRPGCRERHADAQHDGDESRFVVGILDRPIPTPRHLEDVNADAQREKGGDDESSDDPAHGDDDSMHALQITSGCDSVVAF